MKIVCKIFLPFIFIFYSCNFDNVSRFAIPLEDAIELEISGYEYLGDNKFKTYVHYKNYFDSVKDIDGYSYYFILDKNIESIVMQIILYSKVAGLLDYKFGFLFDFGLKFDFFNVILPDAFEFQVKEIVKSGIALNSDFCIENNKQVTTDTFNLGHIKEINREFELRNHKDDVNSSTSELIYFTGSCKYSTLREAYIVLYYYVFKSIERFMQQ
ncbi:hypothetical protein baBA2_000905 (plasmid) [Borrelia anserina]|uniref:hypothetical protein n=1 Tax=Borrelia anserina TaxID=143 RepID=UPI00046D0FB6|nr:hypothetical protein [Borrelia anserina]UPA07280.1 hypothetical protein baBA2_000905 [Borrelia anserina]